MEPSKPGQSGIIAALYKLTDEYVRENMIDGQFVGDEKYLLLASHYKNRMDRPELMELDERIELNP